MGNWFETILKSNKRHLNLRGLVGGPSSNIYEKSFKPAGRIRTLTRLNRVKAFHNDVKHSTTSSLRFSDILRHHLTTGEIAVMNMARCFGPQRQNALQNCNPAKPVYFVT